MPRRLKARLHVSQHPLDGLKPGNRLAKLLPLLGIITRRLIRCLGNAHRLRSDADPAGVQDRKGDPETLTFVAQAVPSRQVTILENQL